MAISRTQSGSAGVETKKFNDGYGGLLVIINLIITGVFWWQLPVEIPLFYGMPYGAAQLANRWWFWLLAGLSIVFFGASQFFMKLSIKSQLFRPMMGWIQTLSLFLITLAMLHIIMVTL